MPSSPYTQPQQPRRLQGDQQPLYHPNEQMSRATPPEGLEHSLERSSPEQYTRVRGCEPVAIPPTPPPKDSESHMYQVGRDEGNPTSVHYRSLYHTSRSTSRVRSESHSADNIKNAARPITRRVNSTGSATSFAGLNKISEWPTDPQRLRESGHLGKFIVLMDIFMALTPVSFIVIGALAASLTGKPTANNGFGKHIEYATQIGPTIFPVVFAGVVGRTMKVFARYSAQRGSRLGKLELLLASQSTWGTIENTFLMRRMTGLSAFILLLWAFSPLGGQSSLRLLGTATSSTTNSTLVRYLDTGGSSLIDDTWAAAASQDYVTATNAIYLASLLSTSTTLLGPQDLWGNVKIPRFETLVHQNQVEDGWVDTTGPMSAPENYSALVGLPSVGIPSSKSSFSMESSYYTFSCMKPVVANTNITDNSTIPKVPLGPLYQYGDMDVGNSSLNPLVNPSDSSLTSHRSFFMDTSTVFNDDARVDAVVGNFLNTSEALDPALDLQRHVVFGSRLPVEDAPVAVWPMVVFNCTISTTHVESQINCSSSAECAVTRMRKSTLDTRPTQVTAFDQAQIARHFFQSFQKAAGDLPAGMSSFTETFLHNTSASPFATSQNTISDFVDLGQVQPDVLARRLSLLVNTYFQLGQSPYAFTGNLPADMNDYGPPVLSPMGVTNLTQAQISALDAAPMFALASNATVTYPFEVYRCDMAWMIGLMLASGILLIISLVGLFTKTVTLTPDMMGYVSSMTYHNPHMDLPPGAGPLDGMDRARLLRNLRVRIADVRGGEDVGQVALVSVNGKESLLGERGKDIKSLSRNRTYM